MRDMVFAFFFTHFQILEIDTDESRRYSESGKLIMGIIRNGLPCRSMDGE